MLSRLWLSGSSIVVFALTALPDSVLADAGCDRAGTCGGPVPLIGVGLPIAGAVLATVLVARRYLRKG
jgi:hypothetical protein